MRAHRLRALPSKRRRAANSHGANRCTGAIVWAALALPGVYAAPARAEGAPEQGVVAFKYLHYQDSQPGLKRVKVDAPSVYVATPIDSHWSIEGSAVVDSVSGATPRWQSSISSASVMRDTRVAADVKVTRYLERSSYAMGVSESNERDYASTGVSFDGTSSSEDNNRTWNAGLAGTFDRINPTNGGQANVHNEHRRTAGVAVGVTQALTSRDIVQANLTWSYGRGYFSDPYKTLDVRPRQRSQTALLGRWNHHFEGEGSTLRTSYRFYHDNFRINAHTLELEWVKPVTDRLSLTPLLRYYTQSSASFYVDAKVDAAGYPVFPDLVPGQLNSGDQRLSAFGAVTLGLKADYRIGSLWSVDGSVEHYEQRSNWRVGGQGSTGLDAFRATFVTLGISRRF